MRVPPLLVAALAAALMWALDAVVPALRIAVPHATLVAGALMLISGTIALLGVIEFRRAQTTVNPLTPESSAALVTGGVYRWSRNPMYLGFAASLAGVGVALGNLLALLVLAGFVAYLNRFQIAPEERALLARFGTRFSDYQRSVRRWC
jgi:protein-S-isoprenylcysteine O-methyltransferase Ste14